MNTSNEISEQEAVDQIYDYAANLMINEKKSAIETKNLLVNEGLDRESASIIVDNLQQQIDEARKERGGKNMIYGALWCIGGTIATIADFGFIFWGAILFGGVQFLNGLYNRLR